VMSVAGADVVIGNCSLGRGDWCTADISRGDGLGVACMKEGWTSARHEVGWRHSIVALGSFCIWIICSTLLIIRTLGLSRPFRFQHTIPSGIVSVSGSISHAAYASSPSKVLNSVSVT
jgi:hypothetical protein